MQGTKLRRTMILAAIAALSVAISGCASSERDSGSGSGNGQTSSKDTLVFGAAGDPKLFDPAFASDGETLPRAEADLRRPGQDQGGQRRDRAGPGHQVGEQRRRQGVDLHAPAGREVPRRHRLQRRRRSASTSTAGTTSPARCRARTSRRTGRTPSAASRRTRAPTCRRASTSPARRRTPTTAKITLTSATGRIPAALALPSFAMQSPAALKKYDADKVSALRGHLPVPDVRDRAPDRHRPVQVRRLGRGARRRSRSPQPRLLGREGEDQQDRLQGHLGRQRPQAGAAGRLHRRLRPGRARRHQRPEGRG